MKVFEIMDMNGPLFGRRYSAKTKEDAVNKALIDFPGYQEDELYAVDDTPEKGSLYMSPSFRRCLAGWGKAIKEQTKENEE